MPAPDPTVMDAEKATALIAERFMATKIEAVTDDVAKRLNIEKFLNLNTPEGKAAFARALNEEIANVKDKIREAAMESITPILTESEKRVVALEAKLQRREAYDRDYGVHVGTDGKLHPNVSRETAEYLGKFVRALRAKDFATINEMRASASSSGVASEGGVLIPVEVAAEVLRLIPEFGVYPAIARDFPMGNVAQVNIGAVIGGMSDYWPDENTAITPSFPDFDKLVLTVKQHAAYIPIPISLIEDAVINFGQLIADLIRECIGKGRDRVAIVGSISGGDPFDGLLHTPGLLTKVMDAGETSFNKANLDYGLDLQTTVPEGARDECRYILNETLFNWLRKQKDAHGDYIYQKPADVGMNATIWNRPFTLTPRMPEFSTAAQPSTRMLLYGNFKKWAFWGHRNELSIATSDVAGDVFQKVQLAVRGITREGFASYGPALAALQTAP